MSSAIRHADVLPCIKYTNDITFYEFQKCNYIDGWNRLVNNPQIVGNTFFGYN